MTESNSFSSSDEANPPASGAESTSVNSQNDVSTGADPRVNLTQKSVNLGIPLIRSGVPGARGWMSGDGTFLEGPYKGTRMVDWALAYAERGWHVFQMRPGTKSFFGNCTRCKDGHENYDADAHADGSEHCAVHPEGYAHCHGLWAATRNPKIIEQWWRDNPHGNIGINCGRSGIACVDVDIKHHKNKYGDRSIRTLEETYGEFPLGPRAITASGGWHWIFALPENHELRSSTGYTDPKGHKHGLGDHVDIKAVGGLMVAAPSLVYDDTKGVVTGQYSWDPAGGQSIPNLPSWVVSEIEQREARPKPVSLPFARQHIDADRDEVLARVNELADEVANNRAEGGRNQLLYSNAKKAFQYAEAGQIAHTQVEFIFEQAAVACGLPHDDLRAISNARKWAVGKARAWNARFSASEAQAQYDNWKGIADVPNQAIPQHDTEFPGVEQVGPATVETVPLDSNGEVPPPPGFGGKKEEPDAALPFVDITNERNALHNIIDAIDSGWIPEVYVRDGRLVHVGVVSGARNGRRKQTNAAPERQAPDMGASQMRALLAKHTVTIAYTKSGSVPKLPTESLCKAVLANNYWRKVPDLVEITPMPFVRDDGTVCQTLGYDTDTGVWLNVDDGFPEVPSVPSRNEVEEAKDLLLNKILRDFPFVSEADRSNYLGLLFTPALSRMIGGLNPFGVITAANQGSGKSLLSELISRTYGGNGDTSTLPRQDEEIRKLITSKLMSDPHKVITFDNVGKTHTVDSPVLAQLLTSVTWSDRVLGGNDIVSRLNDRLWLATGNNVHLGGDMATRSVFVRIDPKMERPDKRDTSKFALGDLQAWLGDQDNRVRIMHALLVLIRAWAADGAPRAKAEMRSFSTWAQVVGGLLRYHGMTGFLSNTSDVDDADEETYEWAQFLAAWHARHGGDWMTTAQLLSSYKESQYHVMSGAHDPWNGAFPVKDNGQTYTPHAIGAKFKHIQDRPFMGWVLRRTVNTATNQRLWRPERMSDVEAQSAEQLTMPEVTDSN